MPLPVNILHTDQKQNSNNIAHVIIVLQTINLLDKNVDTINAINKKYVIFLN